MPYRMWYAGASEPEPRTFATLDDAATAFARTARELWRYGQRVEASLHFLKYNGTWEEYPDYLLSIGPRGGIKRERA